MIPKFYPIASNLNETIDYINAGVKFLQIRIKDLPLDQLEIDLKKSIEYAAIKNASLVINDYWELAVKYGASWVHLGQEDLDNADINIIRQHNIKIGISTHDKSELRRAMSLNPDYIALGPIYFTQLKAMKWRPQGLDKIKIWKDIIKDKPLICIGGITLENYQEVISAGADCISVVTDISRHISPMDRLLQWLDITAVNSPQGSMQKMQK